ncbi:DnaB-like helicase C-terminal domain-containing protein [Sediminibacillus massiliensis]|uniref:DnaB-like helicase C-terminal domain-containing protein n=1 Tax=Sediminibacillus massiliensis TaxID=1926277 RepID=UPI000988438B|nr:DnaB-like helicase C-terminal domain-containing protein [Sediminibacillus massiliensis]
MNNFELIKDKVKLYDLLDADLELKKSGRVHKALCPFHDERTPSFTYYPQSDTFHCFGCHKGGTVIDYVMEKENIKEPYEAVAFIADRNNLVIEGFDREAIERKKETVKKNRSHAAENFRNRKKAEQFLAERGFQPDTTKTYGIGYSIAQNAIYIPYLDTYGNVVGGTYRHLEEGKPKYENSAEDEVFKKSELLYGLDKARHHIKDKVFIVEGYFDVLALYQMGYKESVAFCGSYLTDGQASLLSKYIQRNTKIYLIPDNDKTGLQNVGRNIKTLRNKIRSNPISVIKFPDGIKDANDVLKYGAHVDDFESEHHELFLLKQELDKCLEQVDEYETAKDFVKYTTNKMIRAEMADYLAERWSKSKELVFDYMETDESTMDRADDIQDFSTIKEKFKVAARDSVHNRVYFNLKKPDLQVKGMKRKEVAYLMGRAGSGKTTFILNFIYNLVFKQSKNVIFNSLELAGENIAPQLMQIHLDQTEEAVTELMLNDDPSLDPIYETLDKHLRVIDRSGQSLKDIENYANECNEYHFDGQVDVIMIDYFGYIKREGKRSSYDEYSEIAREIKQMAKRLNCLVFVLTQTNRSGGDGSEPLTMDAARDSGAIEESGDYVFGVYRPAAKAEVEEADKTPDFDHEYYLQYLKNRWGGVGKSLLHFDPTTKRITDFDEWKKRVY